jgi:hypothetical protein
MPDNSTFQTHSRTQVISSIYFYTVMFAFSLIAFISGLSLIMSNTLKEPSNPSPSFSLLSPSFSYDTEKDLETFKKECTSDTSYSSFSTSSNSSYEYDYNATPADIEKKAAEKKALADAEQAKKDAEIESCAATRLAKQAEAKKKSEENSKKAQEENKSRNIAVSSTTLSSAIVVIILHLLSFRILRKIFAQ